MRWKSAGDGSGVLSRNRLTAICAFPAQAIGNTLAITRIAAGANLPIFTTSKRMRRNRWHALRRPCQMTKTWVWATTWIKE